MVGEQLYVVVVGEGIEVKPRLAVKQVFPVVYAVCTPAVAIEVLFGHIAVEGYEAV